MMYRSAAPVPPLLLALVVLPPATRAAEPAAAPPLNAVSGAVAYLGPGDPLEPGVGFAVGYRRAFVRQDSTLSPVTLTADLRFVPIDVQAQGVALEGSADVVQLAFGVLWRLTDGEWKLAAGGGIDWLAPDGSGDYRSDPATGVTNDYEVDAGIGAHAALDVSHALGGRWTLFGRAGWLVADLDAEHRFVIDGVPGAPVDVSFDASGPELQIGVAWSF